MHPSLAWRSTILQIAWLAGVIAMALSIKDEAIRYTLVGAFAGYGGALIQKARASAGMGGDAGTPGGLLPGPFYPPSSGSLPPGPVSPYAKTQQMQMPASKLALVLALLVTVVVLVPNCKSPATAASVVDAAAPVAGDTCTKLSAVDSSGTLQEICAFLPDVLAAAAIVVPLVAMSKKGETCDMVGDRCYTNSQKLLIINHLRNTDAGVSK